MGNNSEKPYKIQGAHMYFIYSFICDKAIDVDKQGLPGSKEYCEEFMKRYGLYKRDNNEYDFMYGKRISRQLVLNMPYRHIEDEPIEITVGATSKLEDFLSEKLKIEPGDNFKFYKNHAGNKKLVFEECVFKVFEDGRGIFRFKADISGGTIEQIVRFMDISSVLEVWNEVKKAIRKQIGIISEAHTETKWVEVDQKVVPSEENLIWQTPQILLHLEMDDSDYKEFISGADTMKSLKFIHYILNKSKGGIDTIDISFARSFTPVHEWGGKSRIFNMCYDEKWYYNLSPDVLLLVSIFRQETGNSTTEWVRVRLLEVCEHLRMRWYSLYIADELLDKSIQKLGELREKLSEGSGDMDRLLEETENFLEGWIDTKCIILRTFEDPSTQRCAGLTFNLLYKKGEEYFLINELEDMVRFKLEHIDKVHTDIMDLARIKHLLHKGKDL